MLFCCFKSEAGSVQKVLLRKYYDASALTQNKRVLLGEKTQYFYEIFQNIIKFDIIRSSTFTLKTIILLKIKEIFRGVFPLQFTSLHNGTLELEQYVVCRTKRIINSSIFLKLHAKSFQRSLFWRKSEYFIIFNTQWYHISVNLCCSLFLADSFVSR